MQLHLFVSQLTPRIQYTFDSIAQLASNGWEWHYHTDVDTYTQSTGVKVNYSQHPILTQEIFIPPTPLLFQTGITPITLKWQRQHLFPLQHTKATIAFDLPAMVFFFLSRYEEYLPHAKDEHGRFPATESTMYQAGLLLHPIVDLAIAELTAVIEQRSRTTSPPRPITNCPSMDIDIAWCYKYKGWRNIAHLSKDLLTGQFSALKERINVLIGKQQDPYHIQYNNNTTYFFHLGNYGPYDKATPWTTPALQHLFNTLASYNITGIHPSYRAANNTNALQQEVQRYQQILGTAPIHSRQHFLMLNIPSTYQQLIAQGITHDYTMGYSAHNGFRAGTAYPFYWYDLSNEQTTKLLIHPFMVMDVTLRRLYNSPTQAIQAIQTIQQNMATTGGDFYWIWHNSSFAPQFGWQDWQIVYQYLHESFPYHHK